MGKPSAQNLAQTSSATRSLGGWDKRDRNQPLACRLDPNQP
ncbi:MAG TPA: hypothetical protein V6D48_23580 [Oculatellaceae cyanobacterium]